MADVVSVSVTDEVATLVLDDASGLVVGQTVIVSGTEIYVGDHRVDGSHTLLSVDLAADEVTYHAHHVDDVASVLTPGAVLVDVVTWASVEDVEGFLDFTAAGVELGYLELCVESANHWCYHRRLSSGYRDSPLSAPEPNVRAAVVLYAASLFRERGSVDSFQSFEGFNPGTPPVGSLGQILRLLRCNRPRIA